MKKRILHLTLYRKYFDLIASGEKTEEYRDATPYWNKRLDGKYFHEVHFHNGYRKDAPFMRVDWLGHWRSVRHIIQLGKILEVRL